jgi:hypothetical protein
MPFDKKNKSLRKDDGAYVENLNMGILVGETIQSEWVVLLPSQFDNSSFDNTGSVKKARHYDITYNNGNVTNNNDNIVINSGDYYELKFKAILNNFGFLKSIIVNNETVDNLQVLYFDENHSNQINITDNLSDLSGLNLNSNPFYLQFKAVGANIIINNIQIKSTTVKTDIKDSFYITTDNIEGLEGSLDKKIDKVEGKGLSTNDYTNSEKNKVTDATNYINKPGKGVNATETSNINNITSSGFYHSFASQNPSGYADCYIISMVMEPGYQKQIAFPYYDAKIFIRHQQNGTWSNWVEK